MAKKADTKTTKLEKDQKSKSANVKAADTKGAKEKQKNETKKAASAKAGKDAKGKGGIKKYFRDLKSEIKKVVWPSREKVVNNTGVVLAVVAICGLGLFGIDSLLAVAVNALLGIGA